jgi:hypothetical protein
MIGIAVMLWAFLGFYGSGVVGFWQFAKWDDESTVTRIVFSAVWFSVVGFLIGKWAATECDKQRQQRKGA